MPPYEEYTIIWTVKVVGSSRNASQSPTKGEKRCVKTLITAVKETNVKVEQRNHLQVNLWLLNVSYCISVVHCSS